MSGIWRARPAPVHASAGFTLLETLVALLLLVIVAGALYSSYFSVIRARERTEEGSEERREIRGTLDMLRREIAGALFKGDDKRFGFVVEDRDLFGKPASNLAFVTVVPPSADERPASDLVTVKYTVKEKEGKISLTRESADLYGSVKPIPYPQMEELQSFLVECYDGAKWVRSWDTALAPRLPEQVRVTLAVKEGEKAVEYVVLSRPRTR